MASERDPWNSDGEREESLMAALVELRRRKERSQRRSEGGVYQRVVSHFERRGNRLRGERLLTEELIGNLLRGARSLPPAPVQEELIIDGPLGGTAAGRFRVVNAGPSAARVEPVVGEADSGEQPSIRFDPANPVLAPGEACIVRVSVDLAGWRTPRTVTVPVECRAGAHRRRLWLVVTASPAPEGGP
jgi:hypothetical protein